MDDNKEKEQETIEESDPTQPAVPETRLGRLLHRIETALRKADRPVTSAKSGADRKALDYTNRWKLAGIVCLLVAVLGFFLLTRPGGRKPGEGRERGKPNLGRPQKAAAGKEDATQEASPTLIPQMNASRSKDLLDNPQRVSEEDIKATMKQGPRQAMPKVPSTPAVQLATQNQPVPNKPAEKAPQSLKNISFGESQDGKEKSLEEVESELALLKGQQFYPGRGQGKTNTISESRAELEKEKGWATPSLIYIRQSESKPAAPSARFSEPVDFLGWSGLENGTRLLARLSSGITTAVDMPVIAVVEYNYQKEGETVVPAGTKVIGRIAQANRQGYVSLSFHTLELPGGATVPIEASALSLDYQALKGRVDGRNRARKALVQTFTGVGSVASQVAGGGGFNGPIDQGVLVRDRIASNVGRAGDRQLQELILNEQIVVSVPANTQLYVVLRKPSQKISRNPAEPLPSPLPAARMPEARYQENLAELYEELKELRKLKEDQNRLIRAAMSQSQQAVEDLPPSQK